MECICVSATAFKKIFSLLLFVSLVSNCFTDFRSTARFLPEEEGDRFTHES
ncbi:hypothetical protein Acr_13g0005770 [Actinidia rufa]|uniref:Uncharacterized protein n=1 Tax=Actinidia rufa TaxID=165716 RepID=A0A7J0FLA2_9ERIC|nr:hypothetical protein Acr_13g0005770 [Actinidia rufa]